MENKAFTVSLTKNPEIKMNVIPGHFATSSFHITHYLDLNNLKTNASQAREVARELVLPYLSSTLVDAIVCMEGMEVIGAYMAEELLLEGTSIVNSGKEIHVVTPMSSVNGKMIFQSNKQELIFNRNIILLVPTITGGMTISSSLECLSYYGGIVVGISTLFNAYPDESDQEIHSMFTNKDIQGYQNFSVGECTMCKEGLKLDAIIINDGYTKI